MTFETSTGKQHLSEWQNAPTAKQVGYHWWKLIMFHIFYIVRNFKPSIMITYLPHIITLSLKYININNSPGYTGSVNNSEHKIMRILNIKKLISQSVFQLKILKCYMISTQSGELRVLYSFLTRHSLCRWVSVLLLIVFTFQGILFAPPVRAERIKTIIQKTDYIQYTEVGWKCSRRCVVMLIF